MEEIFTSKKISTLLLTALILVSLISPSTVGASDNQDFNYLALGDSISTGYGLNKYEVGVIPSDSYVALVSSEIKADEVTNLAVNGINSTEFLAQLTPGNTLYDSVSGSKIITLSIGANDILRPFSEILYSEFESDSKDLSSTFSKYMSTPEGQLELMSKFSSFNESLNNNDLLNSGVKDFTTNFPEIIKKIKNASPDAEIYVTNFYNPYKKVVFYNPADNSTILDLGVAVSPYIEQINSVLTENYNDYNLINIYDDFDNGYISGLKTHPFVNTNISTFNLDPHPNKEGHNLIAKNIVSSIKANSINYKSHMVSYSKDQSKILPTNSTDLKDKTWTVRFNEKIKSTNDGIYVVDVNNNIQDISIKISEDLESIEILSPQEGYKSGEKYTIIIKNVESETGKFLNKTTIMDFLIN